MSTVASTRSQSLSTALSLLICGALPLIASCSAESSLDLPSIGHANPPGPSTQGPCIDGASRACSVKLGEHDGVLSCYLGTQTCADEEWSECQDGSVRDLSTDTGASPLALGPAGDCSNNPCDPSCKAFDETPPGGVVSSNGAAPPTWETGSFDDLPNGLLKKALISPCTTGSDCQFDHRCVNPDPATCDHSLCETGSALETGCSACATDVCAANPSCCEKNYVGSCSHDPCVEGKKLKSNCDTCATAVCAANPSCCSSSWTSSCVNAAATLCGSACSASAPSWSGACVDEVYETCGAYCDNSSAAAGECVAWLPGETDPQCNGIDLTVGVPCSGKIPVCNRGTQAAPSGLKIVHFSVGNGEMPSCNPNLSKPSATTCYTTEPIAAGSCIEVESCGALTPNREIVINPHDGTHVAECSCKNNWAFNSNGACNEVTCASASSVAQIKKVNLFVSIDKSGSMAWNGWSSSMNALKAFFADPGSAGFGVALRFWSDSFPSNCSSPSCSTTNCSQPLVGPGTLTADSAPTDTLEQSLINAINTRAPGGGTPTYAALAGATKWAGDYVQAHTDELAVVVLVTDGQPTQCGTNNTSIANLAADALLNYGVRTYVVGIQLDSSTTAKVNQIAAAGGTTAALLVPKDDGITSVNAELLAALQGIRGEAAACEFPLPNQGSFDPTKVSVVYTNAGGTSTFLKKVAQKSACGTGWYYDDANDPSKVTLCDATCDTVRADYGAALDVKIGCAGSYGEETTSQIYQAVCPMGTKVQWGYLAYKASTPGDSQVIFQAKTANTEAGLASSTAATLRTVEASANNQTCTMATCPVDMYQQLSGAPAAHRDFLELVIQLNPTSDHASSPSVDSWNLTYSCPYSE